MIDASIGSVGADLCVGPDTLLRSLFVGGHMGPPLHHEGIVSGNKRNHSTQNHFAGRARARPLRVYCGAQRRAAGSSAPTDATQVTINGKGTIPPTLRATSLTTREALVRIATTSLRTGLAMTFVIVIPRGRLRAPPVAEEASKKEWQRSKFRERTRTRNFGHRNRSVATWESVIRLLVGADPWACPNVCGREMSNGS